MHEGHLKLCLQSLWNSYWSAVYHKEWFLVEIKNSAKIFEYTDIRYIDINILIANEFSTINII